jgi:hypothetical protein
MALKPCNGCGKEVDETARSCPNCGRPNPARSNAMKGRAAAIAVALVALFAIGGFQTFRSFGKHGERETSESTTAPSSADVATEDRSIQLSSACAVFEGDQLDECIDLNFRAEASGTVGSVDWRQRAEKTFATFKAKIFGQKSGAKKVIKLEKSCAEQFSDRKPFATCTTPQIPYPGDAGAADNVTGALQLRSNRYMFETVFLSDGAMKECLGVGWKWEAVSRDSDEFRMAQLQDSTAKARKLLGKAIRDDESAR